MGCFDFCTITAEPAAPYQTWDDHPARHEWQVLQDLGSGSFSQVVLAQSRVTGAYAALKVIFLDNPELDADTEAMLAREGELLLHLAHPNLVSCSQIIRGSRATVLVLEFLQGCNILDGLYRLSVTYTERDAWGVFSQLASAVAYLHSRHIIHRDIKPENVVYAERIAKQNTESYDKKKDVDQYPQPPLVKLVDLGMAWQYSPNVIEHGVLGSAGFVAPEVIKGGKHTPAMDVFSMGVLLFIMLVGRKPFNIDDSEKLRYAKMSLADAPGLRDPRWLDLSPDAKHLLMGMLAFDPERRVTAQEVLEHDWMTTRGGRVLRMLGLDVALGAATVSEMRRLRFLCHGVVALRRVAVSVERERSNGRPVKPDAFKDQYLDEFRRMQRREASIRNGGRSLRGMARAITAASYKNIHDAGGSVHRSAVAIHALEDSAATSSRAAVGNRSTSLKAGGASGSGMRRSGTALLLSEVLAPPDSSTKGHSSHRMRNSSSTSSLQLLGASLRQYLDVSVHGARAVRDETSKKEAMSTDATSTPSESQADIQEGYQAQIMPQEQQSVLPTGLSVSGGSTESMSTAEDLYNGRIIKVRTSFDKNIEKKRHGGMSPGTSPPNGMSARGNGSNLRRVHSVKPLAG